MTEARSELLLNECREFMTCRMRTSMSRMMGNVEDTLFEMATSDCGSVQASHYIEAVREMRLKKREIQVRFENRFMSLFDENIRQIKKGNQVESLNVVKLRQSDKHDIAVTVEKIRSECRYALDALDKHISHLLETEDLHALGNPVQPQVVFDAFWESCRDIQSGDDIRQVLVEMFEKHVARDLQELYEDLDTLFSRYASAATEHGQIRDDNLQAEEDSHTDKPSLLIRHWVRDQVQLRITGSATELPDFIRKFLLNEWCLVLERVYGKYGDNSLEWSRTLQLVDELIASIQPLTDKDKKLRQAWLLPGLIYRLKTGMKSVPISLKNQADFLSQLKTYHARLAEFTVVSGMSG